MYAGSSKGQRIFRVGGNRLTCLPGHFYIFIGSALLDIYCPQVVKCIFCFFGIGIIGQQLPVLYNSLVVIVLVLVTNSQPELGLRFEAAVSG